MSQTVRLAVLLAFAAVPLLEIAVLIRVGQAIGFWPLALIVIATAALGVAVIRRVGLAMFRGALDGIGAGRDGLEPLLDGFLQVTSGMLLIFPGLLSDAVGLLLLAPPVRRQVIASGMLKAFGPAAAGFDPFATDARKPGDAWRQERDDDGVTIEGEYERIAEEPIRQDKALRRQNQRR
ncbi:MAG: FxsA family protein [Hyphomicrobium sp.]